MKQCVTRVAFLFSAVVAVAGCTDTEFDSLYDAPTGTSTANVITGRWGASVEGFDVRWVLTPSQVTIANRCGDTTVGATAAAEINSSTIRFFASKRSEDNNCFVDIKPGMFVRCSTDPLVPKSSCFELKDKTLIVHGATLDQITFTKLQD